VKMHKMGVFILPLCVVADIITFVNGIDWGW
jgi:hypothetical protein